MKAARVLAVAIAVMFISVLVVQASPFKDVPESHWAYKEVRKLVDKGIVKGLPGGTFKGEKRVSRYHLAVMLDRALERIESSGETLTPADSKVMGKLVAEFGKELALLGVKMTALEDEVAAVHEEVSSMKFWSSGSHDNKGCSQGKGIRDKITITGDTWLHYDCLEYENDTNNDNQKSFYRIGLNFAVPIGTDMKSFIRIVNNELVGARFGENIQGGTLNIDQAYIDINQFYKLSKFKLDDVRIGRQYFKLGHIGSGALPLGRTLATGSLAGIEDGLIRLDYDIDEKLSAYLLQEKVVVNDNSILIANARDYKRVGLGLSYQYAPNTSFGIQYDSVEYDRSVINDTANSGGWKRVRVEMNVKF